jgi:flagellar hook-basal body complex protein FliE
MTIESIAPLLGNGSLSLDRLRKQQSAGALSATSQDFTSVLGDLARQSVATIKAGEDVAAKGIQEKASVQEVVRSVMDAQASLQTTIALRDKVVMAYQEITRMAI